MGQEEVIKFLEKCEKPLTRRQIAEGIKENPIKVSHSIQKLIKWGEIDFIECSSEEVEQIAGYTTGRRTRLFFIRESKKKFKNLH